MQGPWHGVGSWPAAPLSPLPTHAQSLSLQGKIPCWAEKDPLIEALPLSQPHGGCGSSRRSLLGRLGGSVT